MQVPQQKALGPGAVLGYPGLRAPPQHALPLGPRSANQSLVFLALSRPHPAESAFSRRVEGKAQNHFEETNSSSQNSSGECAPCRPSCAVASTHSSPGWQQAAWAGLLVGPDAVPGGTRQAGNQQGARARNGKGVSSQEPAPGPQRHLGLLFLVSSHGERNSPSPYPRHWLRRPGRSPRASAVFGVNVIASSFPGEAKGVQRENCSPRAGGPEFWPTLDQRPSTSTPAAPPAQGAPAAVPGGRLAPPGGCPRVP